jgi:hypothetical protein
MRGCFSAPAWARTRIADRETNRPTWRQGNGGTGGGARLRTRLITSVLAPGSAVARSPAALRRLFVSKQTSQAPPSGSSHERSDRRRGRRGVATRLVIVAAVLVALGWLLSSLAPADRSAPRRSAAPPARVVGRSGLRPLKPLQAELTVGGRARTVSVPRAFLGLSTEYWALPIWERRALLLGRVLSLLRVPGDSPLVLRIGGDSADKAFWQPKPRPAPYWVFALTSEWLREARTQLPLSDVRLILDLNLVTGTPAIAAQWARAAETALPPRSIAGFEIGNEADIYERRYWLSVVSGKRFGNRVLPRRLSAADYARDYRSYAHALSAVAPGVPLLGPAIANPSRHLSWISRLLAGPHSGLRTVTGHRYVYSACAAPGSAGYPTIARLLSENATAGMAQALRTGVRIAHRAGLSYRLSELNSVTCHGRPGVSDTFASALWAPDALFELLRAGVDAVNLHVRPRTVNLAFGFSGNELIVHPLLYGLILFTETLGAQPQLEELRLRAERSVHLKAWAVRVGGNALHVLLIDKGSRSARVTLRLPATGPATIQRLLAPSVTSRSGVTLGGQQLSAEGTWQGQPATETITPGVHGYKVTIPGHSAALMRVLLSRGEP